MKRTLCVNAGIVPCLVVSTLRSGNFSGGVSSCHSLIST